MNSGFEPLLCLQNITTIRLFVGNRLTEPASNSAMPLIKGKNVSQPPVVSSTYVNHEGGTTPNLGVKKKNRIKNPNLPTPVKTNQLKHVLEGYEAAKYLLDGFTDGFRLGCLVPPKANIAKNHKSVYDHPEVIKKHITKGVALGRIAGPFTKPPFENFISSPLGIVPKSEPGKYRIIHDLSYPKNASS